MRGKWKNAPVTTKEDLAHMERVREMGCICCAKADIQRRSVLHHILRGNKRLGHKYVLPLCPGHHVGEFERNKHYGPRLSVHRNHRAFVLEFGTERELCEQVYASLGIPCEWPASKVLPRRA
jgi:Recombination enhancement, RecA-dependent nuclease